MIYCDKEGHLVSDLNLEELHLFAKKIGLKRHWFQDKRLPHYDLIGQAMINKAIRAGASLVDSKTLIRVIIRKNLME